MLRSLGLMAFLTLAWGMNWSVMKIGAMQLPPLWFRGLGLVMGTALMAAMLVMRGTSLRLPRAVKNWWARAPSARRRACRG